MTSPEPAPSPGSSAGSNCRPSCGWVPTVSKKPAEIQLEVARTRDPPVTMVIAVLTELKSATDVSGEAGPLAHPSVSPSPTSTTGVPRAASCCQMTTVRAASAIGSGAQSVA